MGNESSSSSGLGSRKNKAEAGVASALEKCQSTLQMLEHSIATLSAREEDCWQQARTARQKGDNATAISFARRATQTASDIKSVRSRHTAIERQKNMIEQQQLNMMLTGVLVETSKVLQNTQQSMEGAASAVDDSVDVYHAIYDEMSEITESINATEPLEESGEEAALLAKLDSQLPKPPPSPSPAIVAAPSSFVEPELPDVAAIALAPTPPTYTASKSTAPPVNSTKQHTTPKNILF